MYDPFIEESKLSSISRNLKRSISNAKNQYRFQKRAPNHDGPSPPKLTGESGSSSQGGKPTCVTCGKMHFGKSLVYTKSFFGCGKDGHEVRVCPNCAARGRKAKQDPPSVREGDVPRKNRSFYALAIKDQRR